jgi:hypothetical protein
VVMFLGSHTSSTAPEMRFCIILALGRSGTVTKNRISAAAYRCAICGAA